MGILIEPGCFFPNFCWNSRYSRGFCPLRVGIWRRPCPEPGEDPWTSQARCDSAAFSGLQFHGHVSYKVPLGQGRSPKIPSCPIFCLFPQNFCPFPTFLPLFPSFLPLFPLKFLPLFPPNFCPFFLNFFLFFSNFCPLFLNFCPFHPHFFPIPQISAIFPNFCPFSPSLFVNFCAFFIKFQPFFPKFSLKFLLLSPQICVPFPQIYS